MLRDLPTDKITRRSDAREVKNATVAFLTESIAAVGLINPIRVRVAGDGWEVIAGVHRLEACKALGLAEITCDVVEATDIDARIAMIDENLCRNDLTPVERAEQTAERKKLYETKHPETVNGATGGGHDQVRQVGEAAPRFTADTSAATGQGERTVQRDAERGNKVIGEVMDLIRGTALDTGSYLDKIKKLPPNDQVATAKADLAFRRRVDREAADRAKRNKVEAGIKERGALFVAEWIVAKAEHDDDLQMVLNNLWTSGSKNIAQAVTNLMDEAVMDRVA